MYRSLKLYISLFMSGLLLIPIISYSYGYKTSLGNKRVWSSNTQRLRASKVTFPSNSSARNALDDAIAGLNDNPSNFDINLTHGEDGVSTLNGQNEIWGSDDDGLLDGAPAVALSKFWFSNILAVDVVIDTDRAWTTSTNKKAMSEYGGAGRPLRNVIYHEVGHLFGLAHENDEYNVMGEDWSHLNTNGNQTTSYFGEDAADGAIFLYGTSSGEDVSVTHWRWTGRSGEYSTHGRTRVFDNNGNRLSRTWKDSEPYYKVDNAQEIQVEFSYENNGASKQDPVEIGFYLSDNSAITTYDQRLRGAAISVARNGVWTTNYTVNLPNDLQPNTDYWIGVIIDEDDSINEFDESNNATYIGLRTNNFPPPTSTPTPTNTPTPTPTPTQAPTPTPIILKPTIKPTPTLNSIPTLRPTAFPTIPQFPTEFPTIQPTIPQFPTTIPTIGQDFDIFLPEDWIHLENPSFKYDSVPLKQASTVFYTDPENPVIGTPKYILNGASAFATTQSVALPNGSTLTTAIKTEDSSQVLVLISPDGEMKEFAAINLKSFEINDRIIEVEQANIIDIAFDGEQKVVLFIRASSMMSDIESNNLTEVIIKTEIFGPFETAAVNEFLLH
jgi:hypothetical protein